MRALNNDRFAKLLYNFYLVLFIFLIVLLAITYFLVVDDVTHLGIIISSTTIMAGM